MKHFIQHSYTNGPLWGSQGLSWALWGSPGLTKYESCTLCFYWLGCNHRNITTNQIKAWWLYIPQYLLVLFWTICQHDALGLHVFVHNPLQRRHLAFYDIFHLSGVKTQPEGGETHISNSNIIRRHSYSTLLQSYPRKTNCDPNILFYFCVHGLMQPYVGQSYHSLQCSFKTKQSTFFRLISLCVTVCLPHAGA